MEDDEDHPDQAFKLSLHKIKNSKDVFPTIKSHRVFTKTTQERSPKHVHGENLFNIRGIPQSRNTISEVYKQQKSNADLTLTLLPVLSVKNTKSLMTSSQISLDTNSKYIESPQIQNPAQLFDPLKANTEKYSALHNQILPMPDVQEFKFSAMIEKYTEKDHADIFKSTEPSSKPFSRMPADRTGHLISKFKPDNSSIEEKMIESSKNTVQEKFINKNSYAADTSEANGLSKRLSDDKEEVKRRNQRAATILSQFQEPFLVIDNLDTSLKMVPAKNKKTSRVSQGVHLKSPASIGKRNSMFHHRPKPDETNPIESSAFLESPLSARRQKRVLTTFITADSVKRKSVIMHDLYPVSDSDEHSSSSEHSKSKKANKIQDKSMANIRNDTSEEVDLFSRHSEDGRSQGTYNMNTDNEPQEYDRKKSPKHNTNARPDWKSEQSSLCKLDNQSDDD